MGKDLPRGEEDLAVDCEGSYTIVPGFVDVHIHGCGGADTCDGTREALEAMARFLLQRGVTSFCPTTMTTGRETHREGPAGRQGYDGPPYGGWRPVVGVNMEGPLSPRRKRAPKRRRTSFPRTLSCSGTSMT